MSWFTDITSTIKTSIQEVAESSDKATDIFNKLSLQTPELTAERERIDAEERHKEQVQNYLSELLPWETRDEDRSILVDECREAILALSGKEETFLGPYVMPKPTEEDGTAEEERPLGIEKLEELEPLPPLLGDFEINTHVGLIQRMLDADPKLAEMQSALSGAGEKEATFWRNYFFHCAYTRYQSGMSIDEIWAQKPSPGPPIVSSEGSGGGGLLAGSPGSLVGGLLEGVRSAVGQAQGSSPSVEEITFDTTNVSTPSTTTTATPTTDNIPAPAPAPASSAAPRTTTAPPTSADTSEPTPASVSSLPTKKETISAPATAPAPSSTSSSALSVEKPKGDTARAADTSPAPATATPTSSLPAQSISSPVNDFEVVHESEGGAADEEFDGLEAEIARELEEW